MQRMNGHPRLTRARLVSVVACLGAMIATGALIRPLAADALLLSDGTSVEGRIKDKGREYEVVTDHGSLWVDKVKVKKRYPPVEKLLADVKQTREKARTLFEQAQKINETKLHNTRLREAVKTLEGARDVLAEAQEVYTTMDSYMKLSQPFKTIIQELRIYRDQFQVGVGSGSRTPAVVAKPDKPEPPVKPVTPAVTAGGAATGGTPDAGGARPATGTPDAGAATAAAAPAAPVKTDHEKELEELGKVIMGLAGKGDVNGAYAKYQAYRKEGGEARDVRAALARAFYERGMRKTPPQLLDLRRAFDLDPATVSYYESYMQASYDKGLDSAKRKHWNDATKEFTQAIRAASELLEKSRQAKYHNVRGMAYHWRGIAEVQKFRGKGGHMQIRSDYRQAKQDYEAVIRLDPKGTYAREARDNLQNVTGTLRLLR